MLSRRVAVLCACLVGPFGCAPAAVAPSPPNRPAALGPELPHRASPAPPVVEPPHTHTHSRSLDAAIQAALRPDVSKPRLERVVLDDPLPPLVRSAPPPAELAPSAERSTARLPPESIQRVVRASSGRFRACYQRALLRDPHAGGHVVTFFVIGSDGLVQLVQEELATLPDRDARECVQRAFFELHFPVPPTGGSITVRYPMRFGVGSAPLRELPGARRVAEPPPPGFAERMRNGIPVEPDPIVIPFEHRPPPPPSPCASGDPMCGQL